MNKISNSDMKMLIAVCIASYKRPEGLQRLLDGINQLTVSRSAINLEVIVVDNDANGSAYVVCEKATPTFKWSLKYYIEPRRGITYVRNKAIASVSEDAEFVAFIDDDEVPDPLWLEELLSVQETYHADVVSGPVLPLFAEQVPTWVVKGKFFEWGRYPTGYPIKVAFTNNVIVRFKILKSFERVFDDRFALTGGEDSHFFMRLHHLGYKMVWADQAIVYEWIHSARANMKWILLRGYRTWGTHSLCEREFEPSIKVQAIRAAKGSALIFLGILLLFPSFTLKKHIFVKALLQIYRGCGTFSGLLGKHYQEYKNIEQV
jgi:glycosyltransferase involved in cell wall biosynthesis